jgi:hypothetical protein
MPVQPRSYALTTVERVRKNRLGIDSDGFDELFVHLINSVTDFIEGECGTRFKLTDYYDELYTIHTYGQNFLVLKQAPVQTIYSFQFRLGMNTSAQWIDFDPNVWDLLEGGDSGIIEILLGSLPKYMKVSYSAGYLINWDSYYDEGSHTLPEDITDLAERLVIKFFKRRDSEGKMSDSFERAQVAWKDTLGDEDIRIINRYSRVPTLT